MDGESQIRVRAIQKAQQIVDSIIEASTDIIKARALGGEALRIYDELKEWGWFDDYSLNDPQTQFMFRKMIAMNQYRHLKWQAEHPSKEKPKSKWEIVMGRAGGPS